MINLALRPVNADDESFLCEVYSSTRQDELALLPWSETEKEGFIQMQYKAQRQGYLQQSPEADWQIILLNNAPIGRLIVDRRPQEVGLMDIALLPQYRGQGIGTQFIKQVMAEATEQKKPVRLYVSKNNEGALRLYERLEFTIIGDTSMHFWMEWLPPGIS